MTFLLKISPALLKISSAVPSSATANVPRMKSAKLSHSDCESQVFIWLDNSRSQKSSLHAVGILANVEDVELPQVRNPDRTKLGYRLHLSNLSTQVVAPLTTDDLERYRYSEGSSGLEKLGKLHRDRNDKIIALSKAEADELAARF